MAFCKVVLSVVTFSSAFSSFPFSGHEKDFGDAYVHGEIVSLCLKLEQFDKQVEDSLVYLSKTYGATFMDSYTATFEEAGHTDILCRAYAAATGKSVDDADLAIFFRSRGWFYKG